MKILKKAKALIRSIGKSEAEKDDIRLGQYFHSVILAAGGSSSRMGSAIGVTKQLADLGGLPVVVRSAAVFDACPFIREIIVVARKDELSFYADKLASFGLKKITAVVAGGETRQRSVANGLECLSDKSEFVAVHDAARCLITAGQIRSVFLDAIRYGAACAACRVKDTVKRSDEDGMILETVDRERLWHAQTPQVFKTSLYRAASALAERDGITVTDDCMLVEHAGFKIKLTDCGHENIKLTTPEDFFVAEAILDRRRRTAASSDE